MEQNSRKPVAVVTGGSKGIGLATCRALKAKGWQVCSLSRNIPKEKENGIWFLSCDVTQEETVAACIQKIVVRFGRVDLLLNNAGFGVSGAVEFSGPDAGKRQMEVNFSGCDICTRQILPVMRRQGRGKIFFTSSLAGVFPIPFQSYYSASKAAVNLYGEALRMEVEPFKIQVSLFLLGDVKTDFTGSRRQINAGNDEYHGRIQRAVAQMAKDEETGMDPDSIGEFIAEKAGMRKTAPRYVVGTMYRILYFVNRFLPRKFVLYLLKKMYRV